MCAWYCVSEIGRGGNAWPAVAEQPQLDGESYAMGKRNVANQDWLRSSAPLLCMIHEPMT